MLHSFSTPRRFNFRPLFYVRVYFFYFFCFYLLFLFFVRMYILLSVINLSRVLRPWLYCCFFLSSLGFLVFVLCIITDPSVLFYLRLCNIGLPQSPRRLDRYFKYCCNHFHLSSRLLFYYTLDFMFVSMSPNSLNRSGGQAIPINW